MVKSRGSSPCTRRPLLSLTVTGTCTKFVILTNVVSASALLGWSSPSPGVPTGAGVAVGLTMGAMLPECGGGVLVASGATFSLEELSPTPPGVAFVTGVTCAVGCKGLPALAKGVLVADGTGASGMFCCAHKPALKTNTNHANFIFPP